MAKHQHEHVLRAIAEGKRVQFNTNVGIHSGWVDMGSRAENNPINQPHWSWRIAGETLPVIRIGAVDVPEPLRAELPDGTDYFVVSAQQVELCTWQGSAWDLAALEGGFAHVERDSAELHRAALLVLNSQRGHSKPLELLNA